LQASACIVLARMGLHIRRTMDPFTFNDDARILIWPFLREADPNLFPNDPFVAYYLAGLPEGFLHSIVS